MFDEAKIEDILHNFYIQTVSAFKSTVVSAKRIEKIIENTNKETDFELVKNVYKNIEFLKEETKKKYFPVELTNNVYWDWEGEIKKDDKLFNEITSIKAIEIQKNEKNDENLIKKRVVLDEKQSQMFYNKLRIFLISDRKEIYIETFIIYLFCLLEAYISDLMKEIFRSNIFLLNQNQKQLKYEEILSYSNFDEVKELMIEREVDAINRCDFDDLMNYLNKKFNFDIEKEDPKYQITRENWYIRNLIVHQKGIVDGLFLKKVPNSKYKLKQKIQYSWNDLELLFAKVRDLASVITNFFYTKFSNKE